MLVVLVVVMKFLPFPKDGRLLSGEYMAGSNVLVHVNHPHKKSAKNNQQLVVLFILLFYCVQSGMHVRYGMCFKCLNIIPLKFFVII